MTEEERNEFAIFTYKLDSEIEAADIDMICDWIESKKKQWDEEKDIEIKKLEKELKVTEGAMRIVKRLYEARMRFDFKVVNNSKLVEKAFNETK